MVLKFANISNKTAAWSRNIENKHCCVDSTWKVRETDIILRKRISFFVPACSVHTLTSYPQCPGSFRLGWLTPVSRTFRNDGFAIFQSLLLLSKSSAEQASGRWVQGCCGSDGYVHHLCRFAPATGVTWANSNRCHQLEVTSSQQILHICWMKKMRKTKNHMAKIQASPEP